jgi:hypothetical protein
MVWIISFGLYWPIINLTLCKARIELHHLQKMAPHIKKFNLT